MTGSDSQAVDLVDQFLAQFGDNTRRAYRKDLRDILGSNVSSIDPSGFVGRDELLGVGSTGRRRRAALRSFFKWLKRQGYKLPPDVFGADTVVVQTSKFPSFRLQPAKARKLLEEARKSPSAVRDVGILRLIIEGGLRSSEVIGLDLDALHKTPIGTRLRLTSTRGGIVSWIIIRNQLATELQNIADHYNIEEGPIFISLSNNSYGRRLTAQSLYRIVTSIGLRAGLAGVTPETLRVLSGEVLLQQSRFTSPDDVILPRLRFLSPDF